jgi:hypothetical protein
MVTQRCPTVAPVGLEIVFGQPLGRAKMTIWIRAFWLDQQAKLQQLGLGAKMRAISTR